MKIYYNTDTGFDSDLEMSRYQDSWRSLHRLVEDMASLNYTIIRLVDRRGKEIVI